MVLAAAAGTIMYVGLERLVAERARSDRALVLYAVTRSGEEEEVLFVFSDRRSRQIKRTARARPCGACLRRVVSAR